MADTLTPEQRSERMALIPGKDTRPEMRVRRLAHGMGYRYRLHRSELPGRPDMVFPGQRKVIFIHGCYWHRHDDPSCKLARLPKSRLDFWVPKLEANRVRDRRNMESLKGLGWGVLVVWECETRNDEVVKEKINTFLDPR